MLSFLYENEDEASVWFVGTVFPNVEANKKVDFLEVTGDELNLAKQVFDKKAFGKSEHQVFSGELAQMVLNAIISNRFSFEKGL